MVSKNLVMMKGTCMSFHFEDQQTKRRLVVAIPKNALRKA
jgi:hypothetical protein